ncbi:hypothetical protein llap_15241 [Limosa lapponica baueri]|uniref:Uncharacterized protein n=1 Tax=Limosa lapponica baueri TaxID=1758121 RepID=A0A2I0TL28_LIMLA|nr:hypothetical protein llap_15241 [Limosa lapponica baueri]
MLRSQGNGSAHDSALICSMDRAAEPKGIQEPAQKMLLRVHPRDVLIRNVSGHGYSLHSQQRLYFISSSLERPCKVPSSSRLVLLTQRPPAIKNMTSKLKEKTESKHLKAQMEADNYTQCSRKCHFTIREVCGGDDINTHSRISLPVLLRSS